MRRVAIVLVLLAACMKSRGPVRIAAGDVPSSTELEQFVSGAGQISIGMTEEEVSAALGGKPSRRREALSQDDFTEAAWDDIAGAHPGAAAARFKAGKLERIEFATKSTAMPRISRAAAQSLQTGAVVQRSVARTLRLEDIEAVTGSRGLRVRWTFTHRPPDRAYVMSIWAWEVEPGGRALVVDEEEGLAGQPVERSLR